MPFPLQTPTRLKAHWSHSSHGNPLPAAILFSVLKYSHLSPLRCFLPFLLLHSPPCSHHTVRNHLHNLVRVCSASTLSGGRWRQWRWRWRQRRWRWRQRQWKNSLIFCFLCFFDLFVLFLPGRRQLRGQRRWQKRWWRWPRLRRLTRTFFECGVL